VIETGRPVTTAPRGLVGCPHRFASAAGVEILQAGGSAVDAERRGHSVNRWGLWNELAGHAHAIAIDPASGLRFGGCDPRSDGAAIGY